MWHLQAEILSAPSQRSKNDVFVGFTWSKIQIELEHTHIKDAVIMAEGEL